MIGDNYWDENGHMVIMELVTTMGQQWSHGGGIGDNYIHCADMEVVITIFLVLICTNKNYTHRTDMNTDADEVKHRTVDVGDE